MSRGRAIQVNDKGTNPMRDPDSAIKPPPASLPDLEAELQELLACRPSNQDLKALAEWNEKKGRLQFWIDLAKSSAVAPVFVREEMPPTPIEETSPVVTLHQTIHPKNGRSPQDVLNYKVGKVSKDTAALLHAEDETDFKRLRNLVHQDRTEARRYAGVHGLAVAEFPPMPANPFTAKAKPAEPVVPMRWGQIVVDGVTPRVADGSLRAAMPSESPAGSSIVHTIRASIWCLAADIERMDPEQRAAIQPELALLDAAAHAVHNLAKGQLEVM